MGNEKILFKLNKIIELLEKILTEITPAQKPPKDYNLFFEDYVCLKD